MHDKEHSVGDWECLDEIQLVDRFHEILNILLHIDNCDVFITGSNSKSFLEILLLSFVEEVPKSV